MKPVNSPAIAMAFLLASSTTGCASLSVRNVPSEKHHAVVRVANEGWGDASITAIQRVLYSAADELLVYLPNIHLNPVIVEHDTSGPITLYRKGPSGETIVHLSAEGRYYARFVFQFSHELVHVIAKHGNVVATHDTVRSNQWFEESLAETASLFTLRRMAETWKASPPSSNWWFRWKGYAPHLREYADDRMSDRSRQLPLDMTLAEWLRENEHALRNEDVASALARDRQSVVASQLLPIFERNPGFWESVVYLNVGEPDRPHSIENYLNTWYLNAPEKHRRLIREIIGMFVQ